MFSLSSSRECIRYQRGGESKKYGSYSLCGDGLRSVLEILFCFVLSVGQVLLHIPTFPILVYTYGGGILYIT